MEINHHKLDQIGQNLCENGVKLALAESMSAGFFSSIWSLQCDSGHYFQGAIVCFSEQVKKMLLGVPETLINHFSAESIEVTQAMLDGLKRQIDADLYLAVTGIAYKGSEVKTSSPGDIFLVAEFQGRVYERKIKVKNGNAGEVYIRAFNESLVFLEAVI
ncbi:MAG: CinA family protein [Sphingobacterium sp.]